MHPSFSFPLFVARQEGFSPCDINGGTHFDLCGLGKVGLLSIFQLSAEAELSDALLCYWLELSGNCCSNVLEVRINNTEICRRYYAFLNSSLLIILCGFVVTITTKSDWDSLIVRQSADSILGSNPFSFSEHVTDHLKKRNAEISLTLECLGIYVKV